MLMLERKNTRDKMANNKMKGLFRGLRYISQIFGDFFISDNEKEPEMQIGTPTDVKHVAHIGWDGPSVNNTPSWMNEFKSPSGDSGQLAGDGKDDSSAKGISEDSSRKGNGRVKDSPGLPKSSKKSATGSPTKEKSEKTKRRSSAKDAADGSTRPSRRPRENSRHVRDSSSRQNGPPEAPKKSKKNKSKESAGGGSTRSSRRVPASDTDQMSDCMSDSGSVISVSNNDDERADY